MGNFLKALLAFAALESAATVVDELDQTEDDFSEFEETVTLARFRQIRNESYEIMETTTNPKTFWGRYGDVLCLADKECSIREPEDGAEEYKLQLQADMELLVIGLIDRCIASGKIDALRQSLAEHEDWLSEDVKAYWRWLEENGYDPDEFDL